MPSKKSISGLVRSVFDLQPTISSSDVTHIKAAKKTRTIILSSENKKLKLEGEISGQGLDHDSGKAK